MKPRDFFPGGRILIVGHRGAEALAPENTWAALEMGIQSGADILEIDVQCTRDGEAVLIHDFTLQPKFGDPRWVRDMTWPELAALDAGIWFGPRFAGQRVPRLAEVLDWARDRVALQLDLKHGFVGKSDATLETTVLNLVEATGMSGQVLISSWDQVALGRVRSRRPDIPLAVNLRQRVPDPVAAVQQTRPQWVIVFWPQADRTTIEALQAAGQRVLLTNLFTGDYQQARALGVDAVTASDPGAARKALDRVDTITGIE